MFVQEHAMGFLCLGDLVSKERHKAATPNCVPQRIVCGVCSGAYRALFLFVLFRQYDPPQVFYA